MMTNTSPMDQCVHAIDNALADFKPDASSSQGITVQQAVYLARRLQRRAAELVTAHEKHQMDEVHRMIQEPHATVVQITDEAFRANSSKRAANQLVRISTSPSCEQSEAGLLQSLDLANGTVEEQTDDELAEEIRSKRVERVRYAAPDRIPEAINIDPGAEAPGYMPTPLSGHQDPTVGSCVVQRCSVSGSRSLCCLYATWVPNCG